MWVTRMRWARVANAGRAPHHHDLQSQSPFSLQSPYQHQQPSRSSSRWPTAAMYAAVWSVWWRTTLRSGRLVNLDSNSDADRLGLCETLRRTYARSCVSHSSKARMFYAFCREIRNTVFDQFVHEIADPLVRQQTTFAGEPTLIHCIQLGLIALPNRVRLILFHITLRMKFDKILNLAFR